MKDKDMEKMVKDFEAETSEPEAGPELPEGASESGFPEPAVPAKAKASKPSPKPQPPGDSSDGEPADETDYAKNIQRILDIQLPVTVSFGSASRSLYEVLKLAPGSLIELDRGADEPVVLKVNGKIFGRGRVVDVDGYYGIEITEVLNRRDRIASLGGY